MTPRVLEDHVRQVSNLTSPQGVKLVVNDVMAHKEEAKVSLASSAFAGSQFQAPSDAENIIRQTTGMGKKHEMSAAKKAGGEDQDVDRGDDDIWMYEDTIQEDFDDE